MEKDGEPEEPIALDESSCVVCLRKFKNKRGLSVHKKACKGKRAPKAVIKGLQPMFLRWEKETGKKWIVKERKVWRDKIRLWIMKRIKLEFNVGIGARNPEHANMKDDECVHEALFKAGKCIVPCLMGDHTKCALDSMGCGGENAPTDYECLPSASSIGQIPSHTADWLDSVVESVLGRRALSSLVVNGRKATTSLVESVHKQIRLPVPKGRIHTRNETPLIKSGKSKIGRKREKEREKE